jgi:hypothetical protein
MISLREWGVVVLALSLFASIGVSISIAAPYVANDDEVVYLLGAELSHGLDLPDTDMLKGYDYGPYLYPVVMHMVYEHVGFVFFKVILLILLILSTGSAAYYCFRLLLLPHAEALLLALVVLMPRLATGTEFFGVQNAEMGYCTPKWGTVGSPASMILVSKIQLFTPPF